MELTRQDYASRRQDFGEILRQNINFTARTWEHQQNKGNSPEKVPQNTLKNTPKLPPKHPISTSLHPAPTLGR
jgi:hypothetical protein